ncbi:hypothetical protein ACFQ08_10115 [Streptosporangium algeriense]|uniref:WD40 repeat domain-containing protein n=1 Tax=Streptosporangium algeriense TaxID=1682748 RepID=A0ABW3DQ46_9ACTN
MTVQGWESCDASPELSLRSSFDSDDRRVVCAPPGEEWSGDVATSAGAFLASANGPSGEPRVYIVDVGPNGATLSEPRRIWSRETGQISAIAISPDGDVAAVAADFGEGRHEERVSLIELGNPPASTSRDVEIRPSAHTFSMAFSRSGDLAIGRVGTERGPQSRELTVLTCHTDHSTPRQARRVAEDHLRGIGQILGGTISPDGKLAAVAHSSESDEAFCLSLIEVSTGERRLLLERENRVTDPAWAELAFDRDGTNLLIGYDEIGCISTSSLSYRRIVEVEEGGWIRVAWG